MFDPAQYASRVTTRGLSYPCGCVAWRFGRDSGVSRCIFHQQIHVFLVTAEEFERTRMDCACPGCRAAKLGIDPYTYILQRTEEEKIRARVEERGALEPDRTTGDSADAGLQIDVEECGCHWERVNSVWRLTGPCSGCQTNVHKKEVQRNAR